MAGIVTERCILPLKPDADVEDASSPAGVVFKNLLELVKAQPGFLGGLWARRLGDSNDVEQLVGEYISPYMSPSWEREGKMITSYPSLHANRFFFVKPKLSRYPLHWGVLHLQIGTLSNRTRM